MVTGVIQMLKTFGYKDLYGTFSGSWLLLAMQNLKALGEKKFMECLAEITMKNQQEDQMLKAFDAKGNYATFKKKITMECQYDLPKGTEKLQNEINKHNINITLKTCN